MNNTAESPPIVEPSSKPPPEETQKKSKMLQIPKSKWVQKGSEEHPYRYLM